MIHLETPRLLLRQFLPGDAPHFFDLNNDPAVIQYTGDQPFSSIEAARELIINYDQYSKYQSGRLTVVIKDTNDIAGWCGLKYDPDTDQTDIGYRLKKAYWNKGIATEAALRCLQYGFEQLHLPVIIGRAMKENAASIRVFEKIGMEFWKETILDEQAAVYYRITNEALRNL
jgi:[ribosomal protein S5]-alanine N-acetyltransferase